MDKLRKSIYELVAARKLSAKEAAEIVTQLQKLESGKKSDDIAIIGISGRFPKANDTLQFWENIQKGRNCIDDFPCDRLDDVRQLLDGYTYENIQFKKAGYLDEISFFDADIFRISPREALTMEPYQRLMLETAYMTFNNAGYCTGDIAGSKIGVFIGRDHVAGLEYRNYVENTIFGLTGSWPGILASRISYVFDLKGPSIVFDTSCSSGLVAVHFACDSLRRNECSMAFVGGISGLNYIPSIKKEGSLDQVESEDGIIRAFDNAANGTVWGEGVAGILLKPLSNAISDGDFIYAVIKGSGINNNGLSKGITAPNGEAQEDLLKRVWKDAQIDPETIKYIEAHGTGTTLGDTIELNSIIKAFRSFTSKRQFCAVGSVKTNIGHLVGASGIVSLIKAVLILQNRQIPPTLNFNSPNRYIDFTDSPLFVNDKLSELEKTGQPVRIGINSFGFSGTNCHVLIEEAPCSVGKKRPAGSLNLLVLSARSGQRLLDYASEYYRLLVRKHDIDLDDLCYTASVFRNHYSFRLAIIFRNYRDLLSKLYLIKQKESLISCDDQKEIFYGSHSVIPDNKIEIQDGEIRERDKRIFDKTANEAIKKSIEGKKDVLALLEEVSYFYTKGADIDWKLLYDGRRKLILPVNLLERVKYWPGDESKPARVEQDMCYTTQWILKPLQPRSDAGLNENLLFVAAADDLEMLRQELICKLNSKRVGMVEIGRSDVDADFRHYHIPVDDLDKIIYFTPWTGAKPGSLAELKASVDKVAMNLINFVKELHLEGKLHKEIDFIIVTRNAHTVECTDSICNPCQRMAVDIGKAIWHESIFLKPRSIDLDRSDIEFESFINEILNRSDDYSVALRSNRRYAEVIKKAEFEGEKGQETIIGQGDVFLVTGGLGRVGSEVCKYLAQKNKVRLVLLGRADLPGREKWDAIVRENKDKKLIEKINCILAVEALGSSIEYHSADICDEYEFTRAIDTVRRKYEKINGVIHCAGVGVGEIEEFAVDKTELERKWAVKIWGSWLLYNLTSGFNDGFYMFFSSAITTTGGKGSIGYLTGNSYLDSLAQVIKLEGKNVMLINWATWETTASELSLSQDKQFFRFISTYQALQVLDRIFRNNPFRVIVGKFNNWINTSSLELLLPLSLSDEIKRELPNSVSKQKRPNGYTAKAVIADTDGYSPTQRELAQIWARVLGLTKISIFDSFHHLGGDSIHATLLYKEINSIYPGVINVSDIYAYHTISEMADYIDDKLTGKPAVLSMDAILEGFRQNKLSKDEAKKMLEQLNSGFKENKCGKKETSSNIDYAIIGYACKFPMADNADEFWTNLKAGTNSIREFPESRRKDTDGYLSAVGPDTNQVEYCIGGYLDRIDLFDAEFFHISPREAEFMDPEQRLLLENVYQAVENSGYGGKSLYGTRTGVYVGKDTTVRSEYNNMIDIRHPLKITSSSTSILASRISYFLNLTGPCIVVDTACSSSLSAIQLALQAIGNNSIDMAIVSGISLSYFPVQKNSLIDSEEGVIRPFDSKADGTMWGEGVGTIVIKRLDKAIEDKDVIHAVIKGCVVNNNGTSNGITAPNAEAQERLLIEAWKEAGIDPETISYIEAHGTGTKLGDPIEVKGITNAFRKYTGKKQFCGIGSVKANIGHLVGAAGIASVIKMVLALKHKQLPPAINFTSPNKFIDFADSPVYINEKLTDWVSVGSPRTCGISAFGFSGTNCHLILQEAPDNIYAENSQSSLHILTLSAKTKKSLMNLIQSYSGFLRNTTSIDIGSMCYTANTRRGHYEYRLAIITGSMEQLREKIGQLRGKDPDKVSCLPDGVYYKHHKIILERDGCCENGLLEEEKLKLDALAEETIRDYAERGIVNQQSSLQNIARFYIDGADINWNLVYRNGDYRVAELPSYAFDSVRYWINDLAKDKVKKLCACYQLRWVHGELTGRSMRNKEGPWLVFRGPGSRSEEIVGYIKGNGLDVIEAIMGERFEKISDNRFSLGKDENYRLLLRELGDAGIKNIIHLMNVSDEEIKSVDELREAEERGIYSIYNIIAGLLEQNYNQKIRIFIIADNTFAVTGAETVIKPHHAALFGMAKVIPKEYAQFECRCIDIDDNTSPEALFVEICSDSNEFQVAYRHNTRYVELFEEVAASDCEHESITVKEGGVYLIAGGMGGIGLEVARYLSSRHPVRLCMLNRSALPPRTQWDEYLQNEKHGGLGRKIKAIREIEARGSSVELYAVDISDEEGLKNVLESIRSKYGAINGIIQSAGVAGEGLMINKDKKRMKAVIDAKVAGTWLLDRLTDADDLDFFIMFSSVTTLLGEIGQADYTAANAYLDAFCHFRKVKNKKGLTINWPAWNNVGMASEYKIRDDVSPFRGITPQEGIAIFDSALKWKSRRIIIGEINTGYFEKNNYAIPFKISDKVLEKAAKVHAPDVNVPSAGTIDLVLKGRNNNKYSSTETALARLWQTVLGVSEIDVYKPFSEMGGNSIMAISLVNEINKEYPGLINIAALFANPSIAKMAEYIDRKQNEANSPKSAANETVDGNGGSRLKDIISGFVKGDFSKESILEYLEKKEWVEGDE